MNACLLMSLRQVLLGGESDLLMCNPDSGYNYGVGLQNLLTNQSISMTDVNKIKIWNSGKWQLLDSWSQLC